MKFNISSKTLYQFVSSVSKIINSKNTLLILNNFLFILEDNTLTVKAADMENSLIGRIDVSDAEGSGRFCLDARRLIELLKEMPDQGVQFTIDDTTLEVEINYTAGQYNTVALDGMEFPDKINPTDGDSITFMTTADQVISGIENTLFAVSTDEIRPQMMGILWDIKPDNITFVATDTRKLVKYADATVNPGVTCSFILPVKTATVLKNVFAKETDIKATVTPASVTFESRQFTLDCRLIKGNFPDYNRVIPQNNPYILNIDRISFLNAVRRVAVFGDSGGGLVRFMFEPSHVQLSASDPSYGTHGQETVPCNYQGNPLKIGFGSLYLGEILSTLSSTDIVMKLADPSRPVLILPAENKPDTDLQMILMPMNIVD